MRRAWEAIEAASMEMWGIKPVLQFAFNVECNKACVKLCSESYSKCLFKNILDMVSPNSNGDWAPSKLRLAKRACAINITSDDVGLIGAPCVLFSRYGLGEGFTNIAKSKVHHAAMKIQQRIAISLHENVPDFEEDLGGMS
ncbi:unnamed protein product [Durusdinium trenchii]|uniref:Uncharacterized protein n=1 Tax=Durusdinium trenchii TaxID=1381693 RepID=A0ABP0IGA9_9DINO